MRFQIIYRRNRWAVSTAVMAEKSHFQFERNYEHIEVRSDPINETINQTEKRGYMELYTPKITE